MCTAATQYRQQGGWLTDPRDPDHDPLQGDDVLCSRRADVAVTVRHGCW